MMDDEIFKRLSCVIWVAALFLGVVVAGFVGAWAASPYDGVRWLVMFVVVAVPSIFPAWYLIGLTTGLFTTLVLWVLRL